MKKTEPLTWDTVYLKHQHDTGKLLLDPEYQRYDVWKKPQKIKLIDSMIRGFDIPKLYFRDINNKYEVVDGQQRIRTVLNYLSPNLNEDKKNFSLVNCKDFNGKKVIGSFNELDLELSSIINNYSFDIKVLRGYSDEEVADYFLRLQSGSNLKSPERRRGIVSNMRKVAFELSKHDFFELLNKDNRRCAYEDFVGKVFHLIDNNFTSNPTGKKIDLDWWSNKNRDFSKDISVKKIKKVFDFITDSLLSSCKQSFGVYFLVSLFMATHDLLKQTNIKTYKDDFGDAVENFYLVAKEVEEQIKNGKECDKNIAQYDSYKRSDSLEAISIRAKVMVKYIRDNVHKLSDKDSKRCFDSIQKAQIYRRDKVCQKCGYIGPISDFEADHIKPFDDAGQTTLENGQLLCINCNRSKSNKGAGKNVLGKINPSELISEK